MINHSKLLGTTVMGVDGQITIPGEWKERLGIQLDEKFMVFGNPAQSTVILIPSEIGKKFAQIFINKSKEFEKVRQRILANNKDRLSNRLELFQTEQNSGNVTVEEKYPENNSEQTELDIFNDEAFQSFLDELLLDKIQF